MRTTESMVNRAQTCSFFYCLLSERAEQLKLPSRPISLFILLPGSVIYEGIDFSGPLVYHLKDAIIAKFRLDAAPQKLHLFKLDGSFRTLLNPVHTLTDAGVNMHSKLVVEIVGQSACSRY
jgi:hypothetical protein